MIRPLWMAPADEVVAAPVLCRGWHAHPRAGASLVEFAGALPGGVWTDHPPGVHPLLALLARTVNDATGDGSRIALLPWTAWLGELQRPAAPPGPR